LWCAVRFVGSGAIKKWRNGFSAGSLSLHSLLWFLFGLNIALWFA